MGGFEAATATFRERSQEKPENLMEKPGGAAGLPAPPGGIGDNLHILVAAAPMRHLQAAGAAPADAGVGEGRHLADHHGLRRGVSGVTLVRDVALEATWEMQTDLTWEQYAAWVAQRLAGEYVTTPIEPRTMVFSKYVDEDRYAVTVAEPNNEQPLLLRLQFRVTPDSCSAWRKWPVRPSRPCWSFVRGGRVVAGGNRQHVSADNGQRPVVRRTLTSRRFSLVVWQNPSLSSVVKLLISMNHMQVWLNWHTNQLK
jgi:hypothetical protein